MTMRLTRHAFLAALLLSLLPGAALAAGKAKAAPAKKPAATTGISDASVAAAVTEFVESLASLEDDRVLAAVAAADRGSLKGRENLIGMVYPNKLASPKVNSFEKVEIGGKTIGVNAKITVEETDPVDAIKSSKDHTWFLVLDGNTLKVSLSSVWLDADLVKN
jgi:hypothetical protein